MEPLKRSDLDPYMEEEIVKALQEQHPGCKIVFAGDEPNSEAAQKMIRQMQEQMQQSLRDGVCSDCGAKYPGHWPPNGVLVLADGWGVASDLVTDEPLGLLCPNC